MVALQDKLNLNCLTTHHLRVFEKVLYLALLRSMDYRERQRSQFIRVSGLQKLTQKFVNSCLQLEMVDVRPRFQLNRIKTYVNCVCAQSFIIACRILSRNLKSYCKNEDHAVAFSRKFAFLMKFVLNCHLVCMCLSKI